MRTCNTLNALKSTHSINHYMLLHSRPIIYAIFAISCAASPSLSARDYTPAMTGFLGLNTVPNARMDDIGTLLAGVSILDPYAHSFIGVQIAKPLSIVLRQSAEISNFKDKAKRLYPGVDFKLRLLQEGAHHPEIAIGAQSAFGHKRMAGEYLTFSKRYNNFDFTAGIGWGRFGTAGHMKNPLKALSPHFIKGRNNNYELPNDPSHWFSGENVGFFGGVEYFTPYNGLSFKLDYGADHYVSEKAVFGHKIPEPWSIGLSYSSLQWINTAIAIQGKDKIMGRLSMKFSPQNWPFTHKEYRTPKPFYSYRPHDFSSIPIAESAQNSGLNIANIRVEGHKIYADVTIPEDAAAPQEIGRCVRHIVSQSGIDIEEIIITPRKNGLTFGAIKIMRTDFEKALIHKQGSPQEIWDNTEFDVKTSPSKMPQDFFGLSQNITANIALENNLSLSEEDNGLLHRSSIIASAQSRLFKGLSTGAALRLNLKDNLDNLNRLRPASPTPIRSDIDDFTKQRISVENATIGYTHTLYPSLHIALNAGYLEEFYAGIGGEILYRPPRSRLALGIDMWQVMRRSGDTPLNLGILAGSMTTGHLNAWYDIPRHDITVKARAGRFLAGDIGVSLGVEKHFDNGAILKGATSISNRADFDVFGGTTHAYHALTLSLPLGSLRLIPEGSTIKTRIAPFGRNTAQSINAPTNLYDMSENMTIDNMAKHWTEILD